MRKRIISFFYLLLAFPWFLQGQDTLYFKNKEKRVAKVLEINISEISYRRFDYLDGPIYRNTKSELDSIRFSNGLKESFVGWVPETGKSQASLSPEAAAYLEGDLDARKHFRPSKGSSAASFAGGLISIYGFPVPLLVGCSRPRNVQNWVPDPARYARDPDYARGFQKRSREIKNRKAWTNYGFGVVTSAVLTVIGAAVLSSQW